MSYVKDLCIRIGLHHVGARFAIQVDYGYQLFPFASGGWGSYSEGVRHTESNGHSELRIPWMRLTERKSQTYRGSGTQLQY